MRKDIRKLIMCGLLLGATILLSLCIVTTPTIGIANPSAVYCEGLGYKYITESTPEGERGLCQLPNGEAVDAWQFLKGKVAQEYSYCSQKGYQIKTVKDIRTCTNFGIEECAVCVLPDGSEVEVTKLMGLELSNPGCIRIPVIPVIIGAVAVVAAVILVIIMLLKRKKQPTDSNKQ
jgi:putative hemolysin